MIKRTCCSCAILLLFLSFDRVEAHPHIWVTFHSEVVYAADGTMTGVRHAWTFDDMFSAYALQGISHAEKGQYTREEQEHLSELYGEPSRWGQTLRTMLWTHASVVVPRFTGSTAVDLHVPCTFDFNIAATKYFHGLDSGEIPLCLQFSGMVFYQGDVFQVAPISWDKETQYRLPVQVWKKMMDDYYPNSVLLALHRDTFAHLQHFKTRESIGTWDEAVERALASTQEPVRS